jgi:hypothetical protein
MWNVFFKLFFHLIYIYRNQTELNSSQVFNGVRFTRSLVLCVMFCMSSLVLFSCAIVLYVLLRLMDSDYLLLYLQTGFFSHITGNRIALTYPGQINLSQHVPMMYVCPLYIELTYPVHINLSQHVPVMYVLSLSSPILYR